MAEPSPARIEQKRARLLMAVRNRTVDLTNTAERLGDFVVAVDSSAFDALIRSVNRLMTFEDRYPKP